MCSVPMAPCFTSFAGQVLLAVLGPAAPHHFPGAIVPARRECHLRDVTAALDDFQEPGHPGQPRATTGLCACRRPQP